jgi:predicted nucleotidyltransferase component of viral defense system
MESPKTHTTLLHQDLNLFRESISFTAAETTFLPRLIEKDYFCTLLLDYFKTIEGLIFKGGTCLAKVHADFYRLSEDMDFVIPMAINSTKKDRRKTIETAKDAFHNIERLISVFHLAEPLKGANESTQYIGVLSYGSVLSSNNESIKIEISLREPLLEAPEIRDARTILLDPISSQQKISTVPFMCISKRESFAEKFRAALTRREPAIRDYFDIDYAVRRLGLNIDEDKMVELVRKKLSVPGSDEIVPDDQRLKALQEQLESELKPVLRKRDFDEFEIGRAFRFVNDMHLRVIL